MTKCDFIFKSNSKLWIFVVVCVGLCVPYRNKFSLRSCSSLTLLTIILITSIYLIINLIYNNFNQLNLQLNATKSIQKYLNIKNAFSETKKLLPKIYLTFNQVFRITSTYTFTKHIVTLNYKLYLVYLSGFISGGPEAVHLNEQLGLDAAGSLVFAIRAAPRAKRVYLIDEYRAGRVEPRLEKYTNTFISILFSTKNSTPLRRQQSQRKTC